MNCPSCQHPGSQLFGETITATDVRRQRRCAKCHHEFNTREIPVTEVASNGQTRIDLADLAKEIRAELYGAEARSRQGIIQALDRVQNLLLEAAA